MKIRESVEIPVKIAWKQISIKLTEIRKKNQKLREAKTQTFVGLRWLVSKKVMQMQWICNGNAIVSVNAYKMGEMVCELRK